MQKSKQRATTSLTPDEQHELIGWLRAFGTGCDCDYPPPGEDGVIECNACAARRWERRLRAAFGMAAR